MAERTILSWSGGKDSAIAFKELSRDRRYEITSLLTTVTEGYDRVSMHGVRVCLLEQQARELGVPLLKVTIPQGSGNDEYELRMGAGAHPCSGGRGDGRCVRGRLPRGCSTVP